MARSNYTTKEFNDSEQITMENIGLIKMKSVNADSIIDEDQLYDEYMEFLNVNLD